jgi:hypothetical protein
VELPTLRTSTCTGVSIGRGVGGRSNVRGQAVTVPEA